MSHPRILFFGMDCPFSCGPLVALLEAGYTVCAVIIPRAAPFHKGEPVRVVPHQPPPRRALPLLSGPTMPSLIALAGTAGVPVLEVDRPSNPRVLAILSDLAPTVIAVACFPWLLPPPLLHLPALGALNVHPSLLPAYRGPSPLFWIFHDGLEHAGVTVHLMTARVDSGPIITQRPHMLPDGITYPDAERVLAREGGRLLCNAIDTLHAGTAYPREQPLTATPAAPLPGAEDLVVTSDWPARRAFNFIRGLQGRWFPLIVQAGDHRIIAHTAEDYDSTATLTEPIDRRDGGRVLVRCSPGTLALTTRS